MTCHVISSKMIETELDLMELNIVDFKRSSSFVNQREALEVATSWLKGIARVTIVGVDDFWDIPDRDDFPGWGHVGHHPQIGKQFWNWFHHWNPESELYFGDSPDLCGVLNTGALFFGDIGQVSATAFIMSVKSMAKHDLWITISPDGTKQTLIELLASVRQVGAIEANVQPKRTIQAVAHDLYQQLALFK